MDYLAYSSAVIVTILSIYSLNLFSYEMGLIDTAKKHKTHTGNIPLIGGMGIYAGLLMGMMMLTNMPAILWVMFVGATFLLFVGILDDLFFIPPYKRLIAQCCAAFLLIYSGIVIEDYGQLFLNDLIPFKELRIFFSMLAIVGFINAMNMVDGIDGLAGGLTLTIIIQLYIIIAISNHSSPFLPFLFMLGLVMVTFLYFNLLPKKNKMIKVFMGNGGSMILGYILVFFLILCSQKKAHIASPIQMLWIITIPLFDILYSMFRRIQIKKSPFTADKKHIHHLLISNGFKPYQVTLILCINSLFIGSIGILINHLHAAENISFLLFTITFFIYILIYKKLNESHPKPEMKSKSTTTTYLELQN